MSFYLKASLNWKDKFQIFTEISREEGLRLRIMSKLWGADECGWLRGGRWEWTKCWSNDQTGEWEHLPVKTPSSVAQTIAVAQTITVVAKTIAVVTAVVTAPVSHRVDCFVNLLVEYQIALDAFCTRMRAIYRRELREISRLVCNQVN